MINIFATGKMPILHNYSRFPIPYVTGKMPVPHNSRFPMSQARCLCHTTPDSLCHRQDACATELLRDPKKLETWHQASAVSKPAHSPSHQQGCRTERKPLVASVVTI
ncbi:MAG: hypothetical protein F6K55_12240 [Moorea sp. SIO4A3]|nr:hypothetical protein [Moorena sp. SIO4A3]